MCVCTCACACVCVCVCACVLVGVWVHIFYVFPSFLSDENSKCYLQRQSKFSWLHWHGLSSRALSFSWLLCVCSVEYPLHCILGLDWLIEPTTPCIWSAKRLQPVIGWFAGTSQTLEKTSTVWGNTCFLSNWRALGRGDYSWHSNGGAQWIWSLGLFDGKS